MKRRIILLIKLYITFLLIFASQKILFMLVNIGHADGAPFWECVSVLWHGLRLDSVTACYLLIIPWMLALVSCFLKKMRMDKVMRPYFIVISVIMSLIFVADIVLYWFWGAKMDANDLIYAQKPKELFASVKWWVTLLGWIAIGLVAWFYTWCMLKAVGKDVKPMKNRWPAVFMLFVAGVLFLGMRGGMSQSTANPSYAYFSKHAFCNHSALNPLFNMIHSLFKTEDLENEFVFMSDEEAEAIASPCFETDGVISDTLLNEMRPDILMIVWEGGGWDMVMNDSVGPNLMRYASDGILFTNCYANNFRTDRGLVSILNGWPGMPTTSLMKMGDLCGRLPSLPRSLYNVGYATSFVYGGDIDFTNMRGYMLESGFEHAIGQEEFGKSAKQSSWGTPDAYTLLPSVLDYKANATMPRFDVILTLSSHEPWTVPIERMKDDRKNSFAYTDSCLGVMLDSLKSMPEWGNLLVIIVPDHGVPLSGSQSTSDYRVSHIPMVWTGGVVKGGKVVDAMISQSDIAATLLAQMGMDIEPFIFSRNIISHQYTEKYHFAMHCFKNGCNLIDSAGVTKFECADGTTKVLVGNHGESESMFIKAMLQYLYQTTGKMRKNVEIRD